MFYILFFNALLFLECFAETEFENLIRANIQKSLFYTAGDIFLDSLPDINPEKLSHTPILVSLLYNRESFPFHHSDLSSQKLIDFLLSQSMEYEHFFLRETIASLRQC